MLLVIFGLIIYKGELGVRLLSQIGATNHLPHHEPTKVSWNVKMVLVASAATFLGKKVWRFASMTWPKPAHHPFSFHMSSHGSFPRQMVHGAEMVTYFLCCGLEKLLPGCWRLSVVP